MSISKQDLIKIGLGGIINYNSETQFIDDQKITHKDFKDLNLDIINVGTLKEPKPELILKNKIKSSSNFEIYNTYHIPIDYKNLYAEYELNMPLIGQLSYFFSDSFYIDIKDNNFYQQFFSEDQQIIGFSMANESCRFSFDNNSSNSKILTGKYSVFGRISGNSIYNANLKSLIFSGKDFRNTTQFKTWTASNTNGAVSGNPSFNGFYISYPNTVEIWNYNAYNCDLKIAPLYQGIDANKDLNGILIVSTGNGTQSKICYISPHGLNTGYRNTVVYNDKKINIGTGVYNQKITSGILVPALMLGAEYYTGIALPKTGITNIYTPNLNENNKLSVTGISGRVSNYILDNNGYLKQDVPISETLFYKFYNNLYTGNKTFNTGTWNGIIPKGTIFSIELIGAEFNKKVGTENKFYIIYSGFGTNDSLDAKINKYITNNLVIEYEEDEESSGFIANTKIKIKNNKISSTGRAYALNESTALAEAKRNARFIISNKFSQIIKKNLIELIKENRKYKKLQKFLQNRRK